MFGALKRGFRSMAGLILVMNVAGKLRPKRTLAASHGFLAAARLSCFLLYRVIQTTKDFNYAALFSSVSCCRKH